ncbi:unnamed protein product [Nesidiocoris tenuis]|uniref:Uncharacterized protein n=1 Tax=Nesidiocoris tenuis TaxID=355587 RepID=A0A6H5HB46_9HEMI|nr:unnamed protein product [Nesidiocoris tenuis]
METLRSAGTRAGRCRAGQSKFGPAARHGSASRRRYDSENLRPARIVFSIIF